MDILEKSSMILLKLGIGGEYKKAKKEFLSITNICLDEDKSISYYFERVYCICIYYDHMQMNHILYCKYQ